MTNWLKSMQVKTAKYNRMDLPDSAQQEEM